MSDTTCCPPDRAPASWCRARRRADRRRAAARPDLEGLATLAGALAGVEADHLRPREGAVNAINAQFEIILGALPASPARRRSSPRGGRDDALVDRRRGPARRGLAGRRLPAARRADRRRRASSRACDRIATRRGRRLEGPRRRRAAADDAGQVAQTVAGVADYGGSLDVSSTTRSRRACSHPSSGPARSWPS